MEYIYRNMSPKKKKEGGGGDVTQNVKNRFEHGESGKNTNLKK